jgi:hypothetical protein
MIFLTLVPQSQLHPFCEGGQAVAVPFVQRITGEAEAGAVALVCQNGDLVHQVWMLWPAGGMTSATSQTYSWFSQVATASSQDQISLRS